MNLVGAVAHVVVALVLGAVALWLALSGIDLPGRRGRTASSIAVLVGFFAIASLSVGLKLLAYQATTVFDRTTRTIQISNRWFGGLWSNSTEIGFDDVVGTSVFEHATPLSLRPLRYVFPSFHSIKLVLSRRRLFPKRAIVLVRLVREEVEWIEDDVRQVLGFDRTA